MSAATVQDEYEALFRNQRPHLRHHRDDADSTDSEAGSPNRSRPASSTGKRSAKSGRPLSSATTVTNNSHRTHPRSANYINATSRLDPPSDEEDGDGDGDDDDASDYEAGRHSRKPVKYYLPRNYNAHAQTGPKGVIADAQAFEAARRAPASRKNMIRTKDLALPKAQRCELASEDEFNSDDSEIIKKWSRMRMDELKAASAGHANGHAHVNHRDWSHAKGKLRRVDANGFLEAVEGAPKGMIVLVYIYDDQLLLSEAYESHLKALAGKHISVMFVALHYKDAEMEHAGVPALLAYRNGDKFDDLVPVNQEVPFNANISANLEDALYSHGMLE